MSIRAMGAVTWVFASVAAVFAACTTAPAPEPRYIVIESTGYACGVTEGLGCGSRLVPVLAKLDDVDGVVESRVDWSGRYFLLRLESGAAANDVIGPADDVLDGDVRRLEPRKERELAASFTSGARWMRCDETIALSIEEARILAHRFGEQAAVDASLDADASAKLIATLESEITAAFESIHAAGTGLPENFDEIFASVMTNTLEKCRAFVSAEQLHSIEQSFVDARGK
jgi:hypothetical protein